MMKFIFTERKTSLSDEVKAYAEDKGVLFTHAHGVGWPAALYAKQDSHIGYRAIEIAAELGIQTLVHLLCQGIILRIEGTDLYGINRGFLKFRQKPKPIWTLNNAIDSMIKALCEFSHRALVLFVLFI